MTDLPLSTPRPARPPLNRVARAFLSLFLPTALLLFGLASGGAYLYAKNQLADHLVREEAEIQLASELIKQDVALASTDLQLLVDLLGEDRLVMPEEAGAKREVAEMFRAFAKNSGLYDQIRLIDAQGMERVRVNLNAGEPVVVADDRLQDKSGRYYFEDTLRLGRGEVYVSPLDLNIEQGRIELPHKPMIRIGTPVFDAAGRKQGILMLNYLAGDLIGHFRASLGHDGCRGMLLNQEGYWLAGPRQEDEWGFMFDGARSFAATYPGPWRQIATRDSGTLQGPQGLFVFATVRPLLAGQRSSAGSPAATGHSAAIFDREAYYWKIVAHLPNDELPSPWFLGQPIPLALFLTALALLAAGAWPLAAARAARREWQAALEDSEARYRGLAENLPGIAYRCALDADWTVTIMTGAVRRLTGYPAEDFLRRIRGYASVIHPEDREAVARAVEAAVGQRRPFEIEYRVCQAGGGVIWVHEKGHGVFDAANRLRWLDGFIWDVTERRQAEEALRRTEEWLRLAQEAANVGAWEYDIASQRETWSAQMAALYGVAADTPLDHEAWLARLHPDDRDRVRTEEALALQARQPFQLEFRVPLPSGEIRWIQGRGGAVFDETGQPLRILGVDIDITERKRAEAALFESEARFRLFMEHIPAVAWIKDAEGRTVYLNHAFEERFEVRLADCLGKTDHELWPPALADAFRKADLEALTADAPIECDEQTPGPNGQPIDWHTFKIPFRDLAGRRYIGGFAIDVSERKRIKAALAGERDRNQRYLDTVQTIMVALDANGRIDMINRRGCELLGWTEAELLGRNWFEVCLPQPMGTESVLPVFRRIMAGEIAAAEYYENPVQCRGGGQRLIAWHNAYFTGADGTILGTLSSGEDITERKRAETALREAEAFKQAILDAVSTQVAVLDRTGVIIAANRPWRDFALENADPAGQMPAHTDVGVNYLDICRSAHGISSEGAWEVGQGIQQVLEGRLPVFSYDYPCHAPDRRRWFTMTVTPLGGDTGGAVVSHVDITAPRMLAENLRVNERRFRELFENAPIGMAMADKDRHLFRVNRALCDMLGYDEAELTGKTFDEITHPDDIATNIEQFRLAYQNPSAPGYHLRKRYLHRNGDVVWVNLFSTPVRTSTGEPLYSVGMMENITARVNAEQERLAHEARQRDALVREVHHRIKNNLHGVIGLLRQDIAGFPEAAAPIEAAIAQIHTISVIYGLQSRLGENEPRPAELLTEIVKAATSLAMAATSPSLAIADVGGLCIDRNAMVAIALILNELVQNAFKHGSIATGADIAVAMRGEAESLRIRIENPGAPLPPGFDLETGAACGVGLGLVRTLLPRKGARLDIVRESGRIRAELVLSPPIVVISGACHARTQPT